MIALKAATGVALELGFAKGTFSQSRSLIN